MRPMAITSVVARPRPSRHGDDFVGGMMPALDGRDRRVSRVSRSPSSAAASRIASQRIPFIHDASDRVGSRCDGGPGWRGARWLGACRAASRDHACQPADLAVSARRPACSWTRCAGRCRTYGSRRSPSRRPTAARGKVCRSIVSDSWASIRSSVYPARAAGPLRAAQDAEVERVS